MVTTFEDFELDEAQFELRLHGQRIAMEPQVFQVLAFLVANHERVVSKDDLIGHVWPERFISDAALNSRVMAARKAVGDNGKVQRLIRTVHGRGYRFVGEVRERQVDPAAGVPHAETVVLEIPAAAKAAASQAPGLELLATSFVGRADELARLAELLTRPVCRMITIAGPGGVGKTRLAAEAVRRLRESGTDVVSVAVQPLQSATEVPIAIAAALGMTLMTDDAAGEIGARLGGRDLVLFLDNVEHLATHCSVTLAEMLERTSRLRVLVTSREVLGLREEWLFPVGGLSLASGAHGVSDAAMLFAEREAQAGAAPAAEEDEVEHDSLNEICRLVDGMPLAIELAAALRRYLSRAAIAAQIAVDIDVLRADLRNVPARHRSVPGLLEEGFRRLSVEQARALLSLAVFEGTFGAPAAAAVASTSVSTLGELVDRSLVQPRSGRFALHPLLRQFCRDRLGGAYEELEAAHAQYYVDFVALRRDAMEGSRQVEASGEIAVEFGNVSAAWRWAAEQRRIDLLSLSAYPIYMFAQLRSRFVDIREGIDLAIAAAEAVDGPESPLLAELLIHKAWVFVRTTHSPETLNVTMRAESLLGARGALPRPGFGNDPLALQAMIQWEIGRTARAETTALASLERATGQGDVLGEVYARWLIAATKLRQVRLIWRREVGRVGTYAPAPGTGATQALGEVSAFLDGAADALLARGERWFFASVQMERAFLAEAWGDRPNRIRLYREALALRTEFDDANGIAEILVRLADTYHANSDPESAQALLAQAEPIVLRLGDLGILAEFERSFGFDAWVRGDLAEATDRFARSVELSLRIGLANNILGSLRGIADVLVERGEMETAAEVLALVVGHPASTPFARARAEWSLGQIADSLGQAQVEAARQRSATHELALFARAVVAAIR